MVETPAKPWRLKSVPVILAKSTERVETVLERARRKNASLQAQILVKTGREGYKTVSLRELREKAKGSDEVRRVSMSEVTLLPARIIKETPKKDLLSQLRQEGLFVVLKGSGEPVKAVVCSSPSRAKGGRPSPVLRKMMASDLGAGYGSGFGAPSGGAPVPPAAPPPERPMGMVLAGGGRPPPKLRSAADPGHRFEAFPRIEAPPTVRLAKEFRVTVGFGAFAQDGATTSQKMSIPNPPPGAKFSVHLMAVGAAVLDPPQQDLPLDMSASVSFRCLCRPVERNGTWVPPENVSLAAEYLYEGQLVGYIRIGVPVGSVGTAAVEVSAGGVVALPPPGAAPDIELRLLRMRGEGLMWSYNGTGSSPFKDPRSEPCDVEDTIHFADDIAKDAERYREGGDNAKDALENKGQDIADKMPKEFFDLLFEEGKRLGRLPSLLLVTEETHVPWELAFLDRPLDPSLPRHLCAQTVMGRWVVDKRVSSPPPLQLEIGSIAAVAARYGPATPHEELKHAIAEQKALHQNYRASRHEGNAKGIGEAKRSYSPNLLLHLALHGYSSSADNESSLLLSDGTAVSGSALAGAVPRGDPAKFAFVFLNACQVGKANTSLGLVAGFPGDILRAGAGAFIGPLWNVKDDAAHALALGFYKAALDEGEVVGEAMRRQRLKPLPATTTTPLAYVYYGHPLLRLRRTGGT